MVCVVITIESAQKINIKEDKTTFNVAKLYILSSHLQLFSSVFGLSTFFEPHKLSINITLQ